VTSSPVGDGIATTRTPRVRRPDATAGSGSSAETSNACRQSQVEFVNVDGCDLSDSDDVIVSYALVQPVSFRRQVEY